MREHALVLVLAAARMRGTEERRLKRRSSNTIICSSYETVSMNSCTYYAFLVWKGAPRRTTKEESLVSSILRLVFLSGSRRTPKGACSREYRESKVGISSHLSNLKCS